MHKKRGLLDLPKARVPSLIVADSTGSYLTWPASRGKQAPGYFQWGKGEVLWSEDWLVSPNLQSMISDIFQTSVEMLYLLFEKREEGRWVFLSFCFLWQLQPHFYILCGGHAGLSWVRNTWLKHLIVWQAWFNWLSGTWRDWMVLEKEFYHISKN